MLAMHRFVDDFIGADAGILKRRPRQTQLVDPALTSSNTGRINTPSAMPAARHTRAATYIAMSLLKNTARESGNELVEASVFDDKSDVGNSGNTTGALEATGRGRPIKHKKRTANTVANQEDNKEETETKDDGLQTWDHLFQMLGMSNTLIRHVNEPEEPAAKAGGYWNGETLANLGFANIQVGLGYRL